MKQNYQKPSIHVVEIEGCDIICTSTSTTSTTKNTNNSNNETKQKRGQAEPLHGADGAAAVGGVNRP
jgi:hypothetical protein